MVKPAPTRGLTILGYSSLAFLGMVKQLVSSAGMPQGYSSLAFLGMVKLWCRKCGGTIGYSSLAFLGMVKHIRYTDVWYC